MARLLKELEQMPAKKDTSPEASVGARPSVTSELVRKWYADVRPKLGKRWPGQEERTFVHRFIDPIANACNREQQRLRLKKRSPQI